MASGYGRGGRGAALLEALKAPVRKPGQSPSPPGDGDKASQSKQPQVGVPMGRGAMLAMLQQQKPQTPTSPATSVGRGQIPGGRGILPAAPVGRGIPSGRSAAILSSSQPATRPMGRGLASAQFQAGQSGRGMQPSSTVSSPVPSSPAASPVPTPAQMPSPGQSPPPAADSGDKRPSNLEYMLQKMSMDTGPVEMHGKVGQRCELTANYIPVKCKNEGVFQYAVSFSPAVDSMGLRRRLLFQRDDVIGPVRAFDGAILFLPIRLPQDETVITSMKPMDQEEVKVKVKLVKILPPESCIQLYNVIFRSIMKILKMCQVGRNHYDPHGSAQVPQHRLEVWPGYVTAIQQYEGGLMLLTDVSHKVLRTETALDFMRDVYEKSPQRFQDEVTRRLIGITVLTRYNNKTYRVDDIAWDKNPMSTFSMFDGTEVSYVEYYRKNYNKEITDSDQPLLLHRPKKRDQIKSGRRRAPLEIICLIPELCYMTGLTDEMRADFKVMKDLSVHTRVTPMQRQSALRKFCDSVNSHPEARQELAKWGLELDNDTIQTMGRILPEEKIRLRNRVHPAGAEADWGRAFNRDAVISGVDLECWVVVATQRDGQRASSFCAEMTKCGPNLGIKVNQPQVHLLQNNRTETYVTKIRELIHQHLQLVVVIFPTSRDDSYNAVKKLTCIEHPVPSQVIISRTISKPDKMRSIVQKIALQINCKLGGELWAVDIPMKKIMVVGIDVYHDSSRGGKSIGAFVASMNETCTRWFSKPCFQLPGQELIDGLKICFTAALKKFHSVRHDLPDRIIVYRDGVGDGDLPYVANHEVRQLSECFAAYGEKYQPKLGFIVVQKRINTRLFMRQGSGRNARLDNPPPGTVMDHTVTRRDWYDFFLVSQHVRQGTVTPTHYVVVHDSSGWDVDKIQRFSYKMTHLYYNWPGTVRVPAPCQYAHKLAYLVGQSLHKDPSSLLSDRLFYL